ncbi:uncharacterized protein LOC143347719 [Colletes latitarsis]|uniref:uncharacterized protein LOC143347719 n=1 Tax=Colletes latitarsis TaxID=2605962 RepID=UPI0040373AE3
MILRRAMSSLTLSKLKKRTPIEKLEKPRKKIDRFDGLSEEEVQKYTLPDYLEENMDLVFIGINPSLMAAYRGRYYAGPGNHFYKLLHESGLTPRYLSYEEDHKLPQYGIGLMNVVTRATRSSADLKRTEIKEGIKIVEEKLKMYKPKVAVFNGKCIYEVFANKTNNFNFGLQPECISNIAVWVTPSSSARCANFPRMVDKLHFFTALKKYLQFLKGEIKNVDTREFLFEGKCKQFIPRTSKMWRRKNVSAFLHGGRVANKDTVCLDTSDENVAIAHSTEFIVKEIQCNKNNELEKKSHIDDTESLQNSEFKNNLSPQENHSELVNSVKNNIESIKTSNSQEVIESKATTIKVQVSNNGQKRNVKKILQKPDRINDYFKNNSDSDFVNLIKQRLEKKMKNNFEAKRIKCLDIPSKLE